MHRFCRALVKPVGIALLFAPLSGFAENKKPERGVFLWGDNSRGLIMGGKDAPDTVRLPTKVEFLGDKGVKSVAVCNEYALAALRSGEVVQWTSPVDHKTLPNISKSSKVLITPKTKRAVALAGNGSKIFTWDPSKLENDKVAEVCVDESLGWFERFVDVQCGADHIVALTNRGRVYTGFLANDESVEHHGQLGIATYPHFDPVPEPLLLHRVKLVEGLVSQIACGDYHTLFLTKNRELWGCGSNKYCQLTLPFSFKNIKVSAPAKIASDCSNVAAGSAISMFMKNNDWYVCGNGEFGQFGTGAFAQCQQSPIKIQALSTMREFDEAAGAIVPITVNSVSVGATHTFAAITDASNDHLVWGSNEKGQLGNNKLAKIVKPTLVTAASEAYRSLGRVHLVAGDKISASFSI